MYVSLAGYLCNYLYNVVSLHLTIFPTGYTHVTANSATTIGTNNLSRVGQKCQISPTIGTTDH